MPKNKSNPLITDYGQFWERTKLFDVIKRENGTYWISCKWDMFPITGQGIYILYRGTTPVYVGKAMGPLGIAKRLQKHAQNWYAHAWDNVSWYVFRKGKRMHKTIDVVEALLVASIPGLLNGAQPGTQLGTEHFPGKENSSASNTLWRKNSEDHPTTELIYKLAEKLKVKID
jgi:hypothetical protein